MLNFKKIDILKQKDLNIVRKRSKKSQILLYDTQRRNKDFVMKLKHRRNGKYDDIPHFIITKLGEVYEVFNTNYSSKTFGDEKIDKKQIKIAIENLGWLQRNSITGVFFNWIGDAFRGEPHIKNWREYYHWDIYTDPQKEAIVELCEFLCIKHDIPYNAVKSQAYTTNINKFKGIVSKSNFQTIYVDTNPSFDFKIFDAYEKREK